MRHTLAPSGCNPRQACAAAAAEDPQGWRILRAEQHLYTSTQALYSMPQPPLHLQASQDPGKLEDLEACSELQKLGKSSLTLRLLIQRNRLLAAGDEISHLRRPLPSLLRHIPPPQSCHHCSRHLQPIDTLPVQHCQQQQQQQPVACTSAAAATPSPLVLPFPFT